MTWPQLVDLLTPATWTGLHDARTFPANPYPGVRPEGSFIVEGGLVHGLDPSGDGWARRDTREPVPLDGRHLVLAYGSNGNPEKLVEMLETNTVIALRCAVRGHAAVWCSERRQKDRKVVATIVPDPGRVEPHHVLAVTQTQLDVIDYYEGVSSDYYSSEVMPRDSILLEPGRMPPKEVRVYVGTEKREPLQVRGEYWRTAEHTYDEVDLLVPHRGATV